jgi:hypothetical protein
MVKWILVHIISTRQVMSILFTRSCLNCVIHLFGRITCEQGLRHKIIGAKMPAES